MTTCTFPHCNTPTNAPDARCSVHPRTVRAKFRCLSITQTWDNTAVVKLGPVKRDGKDEENSFFWKYTPSGEAELCFAAGKHPPFRAGDYYYVDMTPGGKSWHISGIDHQDHGINISFYCSGSDGGADDELGCRWGSLRLGLSKEAEGARQALQPHGSNWAVRFTHAEPSDA